MNPLEKLLAIARKINELGEGRDESSGDGYFNFVRKLARDVLEATQEEMLEFFGFPETLLELRSSVEFKDLAPSLVTEPEIGVAAFLVFSDEEQYGRIASNAQKIRALALILPIIGARTDTVSLSFPGYLKPLFLFIESRRDIQDRLFSCEDGRKAYELFLDACGLESQVLPQAFANHFEVDVLGLSAGVVPGPDGRPAVTEKPQTAAARSRLLAKLKPAAAPAAPAEVSATVTPPRGTLSERLLKKGKA